MRVPAPGLNPGAAQFCSGRQGKREQAMTRKALTLLAAVAGMILLPGAGALAQSARSVPTFEVDAAWPKVPSQWKLGDASSFAIDAQDNVWLLHRPRTLKPEQAAMAAPPVVVFDAAGNFIKAWGGIGASPDWPEREHRIHIDYKGFVWIGGNNCPASGPAGRKPPPHHAPLRLTPARKRAVQV